MKIGFVVTAHHSDENRPNGGQFINKFCSTLNEYCHYPFNLYVMDNGSTYELTLPENAINIRIDNQIKEGITGAWNKMLRNNVGIVTIRRCQSLLSNALNMAIQRNLMSYNPSNYATPPKAPDQEVHLLEQHNIELILDYTTNHYPEYLPIIMTAFQTGMRRSELCALKWGDIDLDLAVMYVNRTMAKGKNTSYIEKAPKTKAGRRKIDLAPHFAIYLREYLESLGESVTPDTYVFRYVGKHPRSGQVVMPDRITHIFKRIVRALEMDSIHFHNTRHSHAGMLLKMGIHPKVVQERLGHASIEITMNIYSHVAPNLQKEAIQNFPSFSIDGKLTG